MAAQYYLVEVPVLCESKEEALFLQKQAQSVSFMKFKMLMPLIKAYKSEPQAVSSILAAVQSGSEFQILKQVPSLIKLLNKYI